MELPAELPGIYIFFQFGGDGQKRGFMRGYSYGLAETAAPAEGFLRPDGYPSRK
jgi:hypothetical protein